MSSLTHHDDNARACIAHAERLLTACGYEPQIMGWAPGVDLHTRIMHVATAFNYAHMAVAEAGHGAHHLESPTPMQLTASRLANMAVQALRQLAHDITRGALK